MPGLCTNLASRTRFSRPAGHLVRAIVFGISLCLATAFPASAQLRIVTYNTAGQAYVGAGTDSIVTVLKAIGEETGNNGRVGGTYLTDGIAKPIDVLLLQEQNLPGSGAGANNPSPTTASILSLLNAAYPGKYSMSNRTGTTDGAGTQTLIYRNDTVQLIEDAAFGYVGQDRQTLRYQLRPVGYTSAADFYVYNSHYKASMDSSPPGTNATKRYNEANAIRLNSDALGEGTHAIYSGDHNFYFADSREPAWGRLVQAGAGQANDPANQVGNWNNNSSFAAIHSQSPCTSTVGNCGVTGGMDDRFDFQLVTGEFLDGAGLSYIANSYHTFGNNGTTFNSDVNSASNTVPLTGVTSYTKAQVLSALHTVTDHLPVVADYQIPAMMQAIAGTIPSSIDLGSTFNLGLTVTNSAPTVFSNGADVLHYSLTTSGSVSGSFLNQNETATGGGNLHNVSFNTSAIGAQSGTITVTSTNQAIPTATINIPVSFLVVLPGDFNGDARVDAGDYVVWHKYNGLMGGATYAMGDGDRDGNVTQADYAIWQSHFDQIASGAGLGSESAVPEPASKLPLILACGAFVSAARGHRRGRRTIEHLRDWPK
jgi:hypothetical protein